MLHRKRLGLGTITEGSRASGIVAALCGQATSPGSPAAGSLPGPIGGREAEAGRSRGTLPSRKLPVGLTLRNRIAGAKSRSLTGSCPAKSHSEALGLSSGRCVWRGTIRGLRRPKAEDSTVTASSDLHSLAGHLTARAASYKMHWRREWGPDLCCFDEESR